MRPSFVAGFAFLLPLLAPRATAGQDVGAPPDLVPSVEREAAERAPLFASAEPLHVRLATDVERLKGDRGDEPEERPGELAYVTAGGDTVRLDVGVRSRGNYRRQRRICNFPPVRLNVRTSQALGTLFEGEDKLKLVTPCQDGRDSYQGYVLREYLAYRILNELTPASYRVRLLRVTYEDTSGKDDPRTLDAFVIESDDRLAARLGGVLDAPEQVHPLLMEPGHSTVVALFQLLIGNTDWSPVASHNSTPVANGRGRYLAIPYDFDFSGFVDARYATPDPSLPIRDVKERLYRGICRNDVDVATVATEILERRGSIEALIDGFTLLDEGERRSVKRYAEGFWRTLEDPRRLDRDVVKGCRPLG